jgi:heme/copper-type cytochrome/quinol oxidase subunit 3
VSDSAHLAEIESRRILSTPEETEYEVRAAESSIYTGGRLLVGIVTFAYASLAFAYFYLRSSNNENLWRPGGITAPTGLGAAVFGVVAFSALLQAYGVHRLRAGFTLDWLVAGWTAVLGALIAVGLQIFELTRLPFFPGSSGYASCFVGWAALDVASIFAAAYWLETVLARAMRLRGTLEGGATSPDAAASLRLLRVNIEGCSYFLLYYALVSLLFWLLFYVL